MDAVQNFSERTFGEQELPILAIRKITPANHGLLVFRKVSWIGPKVLSIVKGLLSARTTSQLGPAAKVRSPPMLLKKSLLQRGKSFDSLDYEGIGGFRHDGHPNGTGTVVL
ncbi:hypothetical protein [Rhodophyticola porphyridii]|uniref:hypothetical protein n=1 Tax=Rhodophyticola porphyridii TaxID=1852017 RepID=UPI0011C36DEA|nr:hypothetical protein [Rhodophyticola porphyridii]